jgi:tetratricopeptide (TPR) repeat protein
MPRHIQLASASLAVCVSLFIGASAQQRGSSVGRTSTSGIPGRTSSSPTNPQSTAYYIGKVVMDTGIEPPSPVAVLRVCNGVRHREAYTSSDGSFSFLVGARVTDPFPGASDDTGGFGPDGRLIGSNPMTQAQNNIQSPIADCELRADLAGYTSSSIHLDQTMSNSNVGVIVLHSRGKKAEGMVTAASLEVPAKARKEYEKGSELLEKGDLAAAEKSLRKAIDQYPKFAEAWLRLGDLEQHRKNLDAAMKDYQEAINADPYLPLPYLRMAFLSAVAKNWEQTRQLSERLISLDPVSFPLAYYYDGVAEFNLKHLDKAESNALRAAALDKQHSEPTIELLLATLYNAKGAYASAAEHYRAYLKLVPGGPLTERVKTDLAKTEELAKSGPPASTPVSK